MIIEKLVWNDVNYFTQYFAWLTYFFHLSMALHCMENTSDKKKYSGDNISR